MASYPPLLGLHSQLFTWLLTCHYWVSIPSHLRDLLPATTGSPFPAVYVAPFPATTGYPFPAVHMACHKIFGPGQNLVRPDKICRIFGPPLPQTVLLEAHAFRSVKAHVTASETAREMCADENEDLVEKACLFTCLMGG